MNEEIEKLKRLLAEQQVRIDLLEGKQTLEDYEPELQAIKQLNPPLFEAIMEAGNVSIEFLEKSNPHLLGWIRQGSQALFQKMELAYIKKFEPLTR